MSKKEGKGLKSFNNGSSNWEDVKALGNLSSDGQLVDVVNFETERMTTGNSLAELYLQKM